MHEKMRSFVKLNDMSLDVPVIAVISKTTVIQGVNRVSYLLLELKVYKPVVLSKTEDVPVLS
jgi:hypothetical protein